MTALRSPSLLRIESLKLKKLGLGNVQISLVLFLVLFSSEYYLGRQVWSLIYPGSSLSTRSFLILFGCFAHTFTALVSLMIYLPAYWGLPSWLDKYRIQVSP